MDQLQISQFKQLKHDITRFLMKYKFALDALETKIEILQEEFQFLHDYNPIENTKSRLKSFESIIKKVSRKGCDLNLETIQYHIKDIAGIRITCSFISDIYHIKKLLENQGDLRIIEVKDYIQNPKPNGYQSLHLIIEVPVFMTDREEKVFVEVQIRTIAMDFWASLEHKIYYKYNQDVPKRLLDELKYAADTANNLDQQMERLHNEMQDIKSDQTTTDVEELKRIVVRNQNFSLPPALLQIIEAAE